MLSGVEWSIECGGWSVAGLRVNSQPSHQLSMSLHCSQLQYLHWKNKLWLLKSVGSGLGLLLLLSCPVVSGSLRPNRLHHARPPCQSPSLKVCPNSCPLHWCCQPAILSTDILLSFCPQSFSASGPFPMSQLFALDDQNTGVSASALVLPMNCWK